MIVPVTTPAVVMVKPGGPLVRAYVHGAFGHDAVKEKLTGVPTESVRLVGVVIVGLG